MASLLQKFMTRWEKQHARQLSLLATGPAPDVCRGRLGPKGGAVRPPGPAARGAGSASSKAILLSTLSCTSVGKTQILLPKYEATDGKGT